MTTTKTEIPDGWKVCEQSETVWQAGQLFEWSPVFETYLMHNARITVKPGQSWIDVLAEWLDEHGIVNWNGNYVLLVPAE